jgi:hypothetical protein
VELLHRTHSTEGRIAPAASVCFAALFIAASGCATPAPPPPSATVTPRAARAAPPVARGPAHPDYAALRPWHNYYRVVSVGELQHHYRAFFVNVELVRAFYAIPASGQVVYQSYDFGMATRPPAGEACPATEAGRVAAVERDIRRRFPRAGAITMVCLGQYREVLVEELVPLPGPNAGRAADRPLRLAADAALSTVIGPVKHTAEFGGSGLGAYTLCHPGNGRDCSEPPVWIDAVADHQGVPRLWALLDRSTSVPEETREGFLAATLAAARRLRDHEPHRPLAELAVERDTVLVPANVQDDIGVKLLLSLDSPQASSIAASVKLGLGLNAAAAAPIDVVRELDFHGWPYRIRARLSAMAALDAAATGEQQLDYRLDLWLAASHLGSRHLGATLRVRAMVDRGRVAPLEVTARPAPQGEPLPFEAMTVGGGGEPLKVSVYLTALND